MYAIEFLIETAIYLEIFLIVALITVKKLFNSAESIACVCVCLYACVHVYM